jgi:hypothetical protein
MAVRAGFEPAHGLINSQVPYQLGYRTTKKAPILGASSKPELGANSGHVEAGAVIHHALPSDVFNPEYHERDYSKAAPGRNELSCMAEISISRRACPAMA